MSTRLKADDAPQEAAVEVTTTAEVQDAEAANGESAQASADAPEPKHEAEVHAPTGEADAHAATDAHDQGEAGHGDVDHSDHAGGGGGHHDPTDLSHMNASPQLNDPSQFRSDLAIWTFVVFLCLLLILGKFAWGPVMNGLDQREQTIAAMIEEAKQGQEKAAEQLKQYEAKLAAAGEEAQKLVAQARKDAEAAKDRILAEAQVAADRQRQRAVEDIHVAKNVALQEITKTSVDLAVNLAGRIVRQQLKAEDHSQLIREAMDQLPSRN
ncbi:MAG: F0F1 ATP synthase subunit B [Planctomycetota bacterium]